MRAGGKTKTKNRLWLARKRRGLQQKQIAKLLNHRAVTQVSRYEKGLRLPSLETALRLEIILGVPARMLFNELYQQLEGDIRQKMGQVPSLRNVFEESGKAGGEAYCAYSELLRSLSPTKAECDSARKHVTELAKKLAYL
ncbi:MAG: helix-turn-helix domain-containing protein [Acidobacteriota bacterium]|nr:helix-turn-helix domain-containing protein [Acidobacteriota bacterium]